MGDRTRDLGGGLPRRTLRGVKWILAVTLLLSLLSAPQPAHAYLDPGTGSIILQMLLGGVAGAVVIGKLYWHRFLAFFGKGPDQAESTPEQPTQQHPAE